MKTNDILLQSIKTLIQQEIEKAPFNKTKQGIITKNYMDGTYDVRFDGNLYTKILTYPNSTSLQLGQTVKIIIPNNQSSQMYISAEGSPLIYYPVGSYYETSDTSFDPNDTWGGTWVLEAEGIVHVSAGTSYPVTHANDNSGVGAKDGGDSTVTLSLEQIPSHNHGSAGPAFSWNFLAWSNSNPTGKQGGNFNLKSPGSGSALGTIWGSFSSAHTHSNNGGGHAHTNMQPYIVVNRWHRTA